MQSEQASQQDARELATLINVAGEGLPKYLWSDMTQGRLSALDIGTQRAARETGGFSYKNARVVRINNQIAAMIIAYSLDNPYIIGDIQAVPEMVRPLIELEAKAPGSWYINAIATKDEYRGQGIAKFLMFETESIAKHQNIERMSLIVASENTAAKNLYRKLGYTISASSPVVQYPGATHDGEWLLMIKSLN